MSIYIPQGLSGGRCACAASDRAPHVGADVYTGVDTSGLQCRHPLANVSAVVLAGSNVDHAGVAVLRQRPATAGRWAARKKEGNDRRTW